MSWNFDKALSHKLITVLNRLDSMGTFEIQVGELETIVTIELGRFMDSDRTKFIVSHAIHTPLQLDAYRTSTTHADNPELALSRALTCLTDYYQQAVKAGHKPSENWLETW